METATAASAPVGSKAFPIPPSLAPSLSPRKSAAHPPQCPDIPPRQATNSHAIATHPVPSHGAVSGGGQEEEQSYVMKNTTHQPCGRGGFAFHVVHHLASLCQNQVPCFSVLSAFSHYYLTIFEQTQNKNFRVPPKVLHLHDNSLRGMKEKRLLTFSRALRAPSPNPTSPLFNISTSAGSSSGHVDRRVALTMVVTTLPAVCRNT